MVVIKYMYSGDNGVCDIDPYWHHSRYYKTVKDAWNAIDAFLYHNIGFYDEYMPLYNPRMDILSNRVLLRVTRPFSNYTATYCFTIIELSKASIEEINYE